MTLQDKLDAMREDFENGGFPLLPTRDQLDTKPARHVIGIDGVIAYAEVNPDYTRRPDPFGLLPAPNRLRAGNPA